MASYYQIKFSVIIRCHSRLELFLQLDTLIPFKYWTRLAFRSPLCLKNDPMISVPDFLVDLHRNFEDRLYRTRAHVRLLPLKTIKQSRLRLTWPQTWAPVSLVVPYGLLALRAILHKLSGIIINMDVFEFDHMCRHTV